LVLTTGATATELAAEPVAEPAADRAVDRAADRAVEGTDPWMPDTAGTDVAVFDRPLVLPVRPGTPLAFAVAPAASKAWRLQAAAWLAAAGFAPLAVADTPGLVVARTVAMLVNEAADAVLQGVCTEADADLAMKLGMAWPAGPFEWLAHWTAADIVALLSRLDHHYRGERYRASPWLRRRALAAPPSLPHRNLT
jgi:3-hydroxybutyryl-CoA dehydrogenase